MSMDASGKIIWAKHSEIQQANIKAMADQEVKDGERLSLAVKDMGSCEIYPQTIQHNPNGRLVLTLTALNLFWKQCVPDQFTSVFHAACKNMQTGIQLGDWIKLGEVYDT